MQSPKQEGIAGQHQDENKSKTECQPSPDAYPVQGESSLTVLSDILSRRYGHNVPLLGRVLSKRAYPQSI